MLKGKEIDVVDMETAHCMETVYCAEDTANAIQELVLLEQELKELYARVRDKERRIAQVRDRLRPALIEAVYDADRT